MKIKRNITIIILCLFCLMLTLFFIGCAAEGMPSGGPKDEIGPSLISTFPADGQLNVKTDIDIIFQFSEALDYKSVENSLTIFPAMEKSPKIKIGKDIVKIRLPEDLKPNTTYIFSFGRKVQDLQKNMTDGEVKIAFSTGDQMDMSRISGKLYDFKESKDPAYILFYKNETEELDTLIMKTPDYFTSVDKFGIYDASNLSKGTYSLVAYVGNFKGKPRFTESSQTAVAFQDFVEITSNQDTIANINFRLGNYPLKDFEYMKSIEEENTLDLTFSHNINTETIKDLKIKVNDLIVTDRAYFTTDKPDVLHLFMANCDSAEYIIDIDGIADNFCRKMVASRDTVLWKNKEIVDTLGATLKMDSPTKDIVIFDVLKFSFSEPVIHPENYMDRIKFFDSDSELVDFDLTIINVKEIEFKPKKLLQYASKYTISFLADSIMDYYGNASLDSSRSFYFSTIDDNIYGLLSGKVDAELPLEKLIVCCSLKDSKEIYAKTMVDSKGYYKFDQLIPGDYQISIFYDKNGNQEYDWGSLMPYESSEAYKTFTQPVTVRSRWETERVDLKF